MNQPTSLAKLSKRPSKLCTFGCITFSYTNIPQEVGIKKAGIHYSFLNKSDLVREVVARHRVAFK